MRVRSRSILVTGALLAVTLTAGALTAQATDRIVLSEGHVDVLDIAFEDGALEVLVHDETVDPGEERDPDTVLFQVKPEAETTVPAEPQFAFLGNPGDPVWVLSQNDIPGQLFAGLATEEVESGVFRNDSVQVWLLHSRGPADFSAFTVGSQNEVDKIWDSGDGLPDVSTVQVGLHQHFNWAFEAEGDYRLTFIVIGRLASNNQFAFSDLVNIKFHVGAL